MHVSINCPHCKGEDVFQHAIPLKPQNDCVYEVVRRNGHRFTANILYHQFQLLFEIAVNAIVDGYYREALGSFTASYERFMELFLKIVTKARDLDSEEIKRSWRF